MWISLPCFGKKTGVLFFLVALVLCPFDAWSYEGLIVGNSYMYANGNKTSAVAEKCFEQGTTPWVDASIAVVAKGGWTFKKHAADGTNSGQQLASWLTGDDKPLDDVILQEQSQTPGFACINDPLFIQSLEGAKSLDSLIESKGASTWFIMTWGRRNGDSMNAFLYPDFLAMQACIEQGYYTYRSELSTEERPVYVAPAGEAWKWIYDDHVAKGENPLDGSSLFSRLYTGDGSHPSVQGSVLNGLVLYGALTGRSPQESEFTFSGVQETDYALMRDAAHAVVFEASMENVPALDGEAPPYPWIIALSAGLLEGGGTEPILGESVNRPLYVVRESIGFDGVIRLGSQDEAALDGRLLLEDGGKLSASSVVIEGAYSSLEVSGGELDVPAVVGSLNQSGGLWSAETSVSITGDWMFGESAAFNFLGESPATGQEPLIDVGGSSVLSGALTIPSSTQDYVAVRAASIELQDVQVVAPSGEPLLWELQEQEEGKQVLLMLGTGGAEEVGGDEDVTDSADGGDVSEPDESGDAAQWLEDTENDGAGDSGEDVDGGELSTEMDGQQGPEEDSQASLSSDVEEDARVTNPEEDAESEVEDGIVDSGSGSRNGDELGADGLSNSETDRVAEESSGESPNQETGTPTEDATAVQGETAGDTVLEEGLARDVIHESDEGCRVLPASPARPVVGLVLLCLLFIRVHSQREV